MTWRNGRPATHRELSTVRQGVDGLRGPVEETARQVDLLPGIQRDLNEVKRGMEAHRANSAAAVPGVTEALAGIERELVRLRRQVAGGGQSRDADGGTAAATRDVVEMLGRIECALTEMRPHLAGVQGGANAPATTAPNPAVPCG